MSDFRAGHPPAGEINNTSSAIARFGSLESDAELEAIAVMNEESLRIGQEGLTFLDVAIIVEDDVVAYKNHQFVMTPDEIAVINELWPHWYRGRAEIHLESELAAKELAEKLQSCAEKDSPPYSLEGSSVVFDNHFVVIDIRVPVSPAVEKFILVAFGSRFKPNPQA